MARSSGRSAYNDALKWPLEYAIRLSAGWIVMLISGSKYFLLQSWRVLDYLLIIFQCQQFGMNNEITFGQFLWTFRITLRAFWKLFRTDHWKTAIILSMFRDTLTVQVDSFPLSLPPSFSPVSLSLSPPPPLFLLFPLFPLSSLYFYRCFSFCWHIWWRWTYCCQRG